jgi:hypothetical protein
MIRKQGPRVAGMRPSAIADGRRYSENLINHPSVKEAEA